MQDNAWIKEFAGAITVCDAEGIIIDMNDKAAESFNEYGGRKLIGSNVLDCHPPAARKKLEKMMSGIKRNVYTITTKGVKKLIYQEPWTIDGKYAGFVELSMEIPDRMPHFDREF